MNFANPAKINFLNLLQISKKAMTFLVVAAFVMATGVAANAGHEEALKNLKINDIKNGTGAQAVMNSKVNVHYTGWLEDGTKFDSSLDRDTPFTFTIGAGGVIKGWDYGVEGMRVGGKRELTIPPELGYGPDGYPGAIPPNATLKFEIELLDVSGPNYTNIDNIELKKLLEKGVPIVDIRTAKEWSETGVIDGSKTITSFDESGRYVQTFLDDLGKVAGKDDEVILICRTGNRTAAIAQALSDRAGYKKVYNVQNGIVNWIKENNPVVKN